MQRKRSVYLQAFETLMSLEVFGSVSRRLGRGEPANGQRDRCLWESTAAPSHWCVCAHSRWIDRATKRTRVKRRRKSAPSSTGSIWRSTFLWPLAIGSPGCTRTRRARNQALHTRICQAQARLDVSPRSPHAVIARRGRAHRCACQDRLLHAY